MKSNMFAIVAAVACSIGSVIISRLSKENTISVFAVIAVQSGIQCVLCTIVCFYARGPFGAIPSRIPGWNILFLLLFLGIAMFASDVANISAYRSGGSLLTVTSMFLMYPALATIIQNMIDRRTPNWYEIGGYAIISIGILFIMYGQRADSSHGLG